MTLRYCIALIAGVLSPILAAEAQGMATHEDETRRLDAIRLSTEAVFRSKEFTIGCVPAPFPTTPAGPAYTSSVIDGQKTARVTIWRVPCSGSDAQTLVTFEPLVGDPFVCSASVKILQNGQQIDGVFLSRHPTNVDSLCANLFLASTAWLRPATSSAIPFDDDTAFTYLYTDGFSTARTEVPAYNPAQYGGSSSAFTLSAKLAGTWYVASMPGQGWFFDINDASKQFVMSWFTWTASATGHDWYTGLGTFVGDKANLTLYRSTGGRFANAQAVSTTAAGTAQVTFTSCTTGSMSYTFSDGRTGTLPIVRLTDAPPGC